MKKHNPLHSLQKPVALSLFLLTTISVVTKSQTWSPTISPYNFLGGWFQDPGPPVIPHGLTSSGVLNAFEPNPIFSSGGTAVSAGPGAALVLYASNTNAVTFYEVGNITSTTEALSITNNDYISARITINTGINSLRVARVSSNAFNTDGVASGSYSYALYVSDITTGGAQIKLSNTTVTQPAVGATTFARDGIPAQVTQVVLSPGHQYEFRWYFYNVTLNYSRTSGPAPQANSIALDNPQFFVQQANMVVPVLWLNVSGTLNNNKQAILSFKVNETDVTNYEIEKSNDGRIFNTITSINSKGNGENSYQFTDAVTVEGTKYYRIKQVDIDGSFSYSTIIKLSNKSKSKLTVYGNPTKNTVTIGGATVGTTAILSDINGKVLQQISVTTTSFTLNMSQYLSLIHI